MRGTKQLALILLVMVTAVMVASGLAVAATITGNDNDNSIEGTNQDDTISGEGGKDTIKGLGGKDQINGGENADALYGGDKQGTEAGGNNFLGGDEGNDTLLVGDASADEMRGGIDDDTLSGMGGSDNLDGGLGSDTLYGADDEQTVLGGNDTISGNDGDDTVAGGSGADKLYGNQGADILTDGPENDAAVDKIYGGDGDDTISSVNITASRDVVDCGPGNDSVQADAIDDLSNDCENVEVIEVEENSLQTDIEAYAESFDVPIEEATRRMNIQNGPVGERIDELETELTEQESDTFAGLYYQHKPEYGIVTRFTENGEETIQLYVRDDQQLAELVEVRDGASATLSKLEADQVEATDIVQEAGVPAESFVDVVDNDVKIQVTDAESLNNATTRSSSSTATTVAAQLPAEVEVVEVEQLLQPSANVFGGLKLTYGPYGPPEVGYCTIGFSVGNLDGRKGVATAGHCPPSPGLNDGRQMYFAGTRFPLVGTGQRHGPYDVQWHTTPGFVPRAWFLSGGSVRPVQGT